MKKEILITGIICLFVGVGIQPAFANENISINRPSENIEDCNCQVADNYNLVRLERLFNRIESLLDRVEILTKLIPILSIDNPEVIKGCEELSVKIRPLEEMNEEFNSDSPFLDNYPDCDNIWWLFMGLVDFAEFIAILMQKSVILKIFLLPLYITVATLGMFVLAFYLFYCTGPPP